MSQTKQCSKCRESKSTSLFYKNRSQPDGLSNYCKSCRKEIDKKTREKHREINSTGINTYAPKLKICSRCGEQKPIEEFHNDCTKRDGKHSYCKICGRKKWLKTYYNNPEKYQSASREWKAKNKDRVKHYSRARYAENKEKENRRRRKDRAKNPDKYLKWGRDWRNNNRERTRLLNRARKSTVRANGGSYTPEEWIQLCNQYGWMCLCCGTHNSVKPLTTDHVVPVTKGGSSNIANLQGLCRSCNSAKSTKTTDYRLEQNMHPTVLSHLQTTRNL